MSSRKNSCNPKNTLKKVINHISKTDKEKLELARCFLYPILRFINIGFKVVAKKQTPYKYAVARMVKEAISSNGHPNEYLLDFSRIILSEGVLTPPQVESVSFIDNACDIILADNSNEGNAKPTDVSLVLFYNVVKNEFTCFLKGNPRNDATCLYQLPKHWLGDRVHLYLSMRSLDGKLVSDSEYLGDYIVQ